MAPWPGGSPGYRVIVKAALVLAGAMACTYAGFRLAGGGRLAGAGEMAPTAAVTITPVENDPFTPSSTDPADQAAPDAPSGAEEAAAAETWPGEEVRGE